MLYHPDITEIRPIMAKAARAWPQLESRIQKAEQILLSFDLRFRGAPQNAWQVASQAKDDGTAKWYAVDTDGCNCPDFISGRGRAGRRVYCKHFIAWSVYREILTNVMLSLIDEYALFNHANLRRINRQAEPIILSVGDQLRGAAYDGAELRIRFRHDAARNRRQFAGPADMAQFAHWLNGAQKAIREEAERKFIEQADSMIVDSMILPYEDWRALYMQER